MEVKVTIKKRPNTKLQDLLKKKLNSQANRAFQNQTKYPGKA